MCLLFIAAFTHADAGATALHSVVTVLEPADPVPAGASLIRQVSFSGNNPASDCAYFELVQLARQTAGTLGANVIKIQEHDTRNGKRNCDEITVAFYSLSDIRAAERRFAWSKSRKLTWDDFRGPVPRNADDRTAAETACGMGFETNTVTTHNTPKVFVYNTFETTTSWVRPGEATAAVLLHEQSHFDICELYTRKMRERFSKARITVHNLQSVVRSIYEATHREYTARQERYERETRHGLIAAEQQRWTDMINRELAETEQWMSE